MVNPSPPIQCSLRIYIMLQRKSVHRDTSVYLTRLVQNFLQSLVVYIQLKVIWIYPLYRLIYYAQFFPLIQLFQNVMKFQGI
jgi:hypothetical protein